MVLKIEGLDRLNRTFSEAQKALVEIDGEIGIVTFNPEDPASIEAAIQDVERMIDERLGPYASNLIVGPLIDGMKGEYRKGILDKAAAARLEGDTDGE
ncbi:hypothetical protein [Mesorhizobium sp. B2-6-4]|uniref:hypothetical protein n=1 Tax=Mesorhizobium sp. B2-6-4 TaxID=2589913 RepID=UPI001129AC81|nr:hypothetical protein [Mesorhizobium sp. B2-6-4]TPJ52378.1 hypothetical protein FJ426_16745 [Mesorhizobium sp. B2-6-4]